MRLVLPVFDGIIMDGHPIFWVVDSPRFMHIKYETTPRNCWTHYPFLPSNRWAEFRPELIEFLVDMLKHAHWQRIDTIFDIKMKSILPIFIFISLKLIELQKIYQN